MQAGSRTCALASRCDLEHVVQTALVTRLLGEKGVRPSAAQTTARLQDLVFEHAREEEARLFPEARHRLEDDLKGIGELLERRRAEIMGPTAPV